LRKRRPYKPNILTAFGVIFLLTAVIVPIQNMIVWGPDFVSDFYTSSEITAEKISIGVIVFGSLLILVGYKREAYIE
jgi:hypothetical protein